MQDFTDPEARTSQIFTSPEQQVNFTLCDRKEKISVYLCMLANIEGRNTDLEEMPVQIKGSLLRDRNVLVTKILYVSFTKSIALWTETHPLLNWRKIMSFGAKSTTLNLNTVMDTEFIRSMVEEACSWFQKTAFMSTTGKDSESNSQMSRCLILLRERHHLKWQWQTLGHYSSISSITSDLLRV